MDLAIAALKSKKFECKHLFSLIRVLNIAESEQAKILLSPLKLIFDQKLTKFFIYSLSCMQKIIELKEPLQKVIASHIYLFT